MKAGKLVHIITVQRASVAVNDAGTPIDTWAHFATLRAELVEQSTEEFIRSQGAAEEAAIVFRTRFVAGITPADRVEFDGVAFNLREVAEIGRRKGLELRCVKFGA